MELPHSTDEGRSTERFLDEGRSIKRFLAQSRVLLAGSSSSAAPVSSQLASSLSYLVRLPPEAGNQNRYRYRLLAAHRPRQLAIASYKVPLGGRTGSVKGAGYRGEAYP